MGKYGTPPYYYWIYKAAKVLNCSFMELAKHEERLDLMQIAFSIEAGESEGEMTLRANPLYKEKVKKFQKDAEIK